MPILVQKIVLTFFLAVISFGCINLADTSPVAEKQTPLSFSLSKLEDIEIAITKACKENRLPGGVLWIEHSDNKFTKAYGKASTTPIHSLAQIDTIYDAVIKAIPGKLIPKGIEKFGGTAEEIGQSAEKLGKELLKELLDK